MSIIRRLFATTAAAAFIFLVICTDQAWSCHACGHTGPCGQTWVEVEQEYVVKVPYTEVVERTVNVCVPHVEQIEQTYTAMVPHSEVKKGTKTVQRSIPETKMVTISRDFGRWETPPCEKLIAPPDAAIDRCHRCHLHVTCNCGHCRTCCHQEAPCDCREDSRSVDGPVWIPDVRTKEISVTTYRVVSEEVPYEYTITVHRPEELTRTVDLVQYTMEERKQKRSVLRYREETRVRKVRVRQPLGECCAAVCCH